ncbi:MAG: hypothetical protein KDA76_06830 [Planctomycetaceae bacterium]|nr:hypothetical protein [Planctomycetaceae bacterium]
MRNMLHSLEENFKSFAGRFVRSYWQVVKNGDFQMPPNEPVEETVEELIADVSFTTGVRDASRKSKAVYELLMTGKLGDGWRFGFRWDHDRWKLIDCTARSDNESQPHDLLGEIYSKYFSPFLLHVTDAANAKQSI